MHDHCSFGPFIANCFFLLIIPFQQSLTTLGLLHLHEYLMCGDRKDIVLYMFNERSGSTLLALKCSVYLLSTESHLFHTKSVNI